MSDKEQKTSRSSKRDEKASGPSLEAAVAERGQAGGRGRRASAYVTRDLTKGSVQRTIWFLAWPQMVEGSLQVINQLVDLFWAGLLGFRTVAGVGVAQNYLMLAQTARFGFDTSMAAMIARAIGAGNRALANHVALQSFTLSAIYSFLVVLVGLFLTEPLLRLLGVSGEVLGQATSYMRILLVGMGSASFARMSGAALEASGDVLTPMRASIVARVAQLILAPVLVFGWWWFPSLGITGLALANVVSQFLAVVINFRVLFTGTSRLHLTLRGYRLDFPLLWRLVKLGVPASMTGIERTTAFLVLTGIVARFGDPALAAYTVARRVEGLVHLTSTGLGRAGGTLVGQNLGAAQPERAKQTILWASGYAVLILVFFAASVFAFPRAYVSVFLRDPEVVGIAITWLRIEALGIVALGVGQTLNECFNRAGDTIGVMILNLVRLWALEVPLAFTLSLATDLEHFGVAWAAVIALWARIVFFVPYYFWARWLRIKV